MAYLSGLVVRVTDQGRLVADMESFGSDMFREAGATRVRVLQNVMGGEQAGEINIACEWDSLDAAMRAPGDLRAKQEMIDSMQGAGVQTIRRSLIAIDAERGTQEGEFASLLVASGDQIDPATAAARHANTCEAFPAKGVPSASRLRTNFLVRPRLGRAARRGAAVRMPAGGSLPAAVARRQ